MVIDLPGTYSLEPLSPDEAVVKRVLAGELALPPDALLVVADACTLERSLLFLAQVLREGLPTCLVLTMTDELHARGGQLDLAHLERALGIPVLGVVGHRGLGVEALRARLAAPESWSRPHLLPPEHAAGRADWAASVLAHVVHRRPAAHRWTEAIDRVVLHPLAGSAAVRSRDAGVLPADLRLGDARDGRDRRVGRTGRAQPPAACSAAGALSDFVADGLIAGVGSVVIFLPQIALLFAFLCLLEDVGYMARAAFVMDRVMGRIGLEGRAFMSLLSWYACAVPGIMATRTIPSPRSRLATILVAPLMTCSARLPVYALLIGAFVPGRRGVRSRRPAGPDAAACTCSARVGAARRGAPEAHAAARRGAALLHGAAAVSRADAAAVGESGLGQRLRVPAPRRHDHPVRQHGPLGAAQRASRGCAGRQPEAQARRFALEHSLAGRAGHAIEPLIAPLGFDWKIGVGLLASLAAREVIVATLAQIYAAADEETSLRQAIAPTWIPPAARRSSRARRWRPCSSSSCSRCNACPPSR